jgi:hypothetical protein
MATPDISKDRARFSEKLFDVSEKIILQYISDFLAKPSDELFINNNTDSLVTEPLIYKPLPETDNKYIYLGLEIVPPGYICNLYPASSKDERISKLFNLEIIQEGIKFLNYSICEVFKAITMASLTDKNALEGYHIEYDPESGTFLFMYIDPTRRKILESINIYEYLMSFKTPDANNEIKFDKLTDEEKNYYEVNLQNILKVLKEVNETNDDDISRMESEELKINNEIIKKNRIGIVFKELTKDDMPDVFKKRIEAVIEEDEEKNYGNDDETDEEDDEYDENPDDFN